MVHLCDVHLDDPCMATPSDKSFSSDAAGASCCLPKHLFLGNGAKCMPCSNSWPKANPHTLPTEFVKVDLDFAKCICSSAAQAFKRAATLTDWGD